MRKIKISKRSVKVFSLIFLVVLAILLLIQPVQAAPGDWAGKFIGGFLGWIIGALGVLLALIIEALISIAQFNTFVNHEAVIAGWSLVRNISNMFFVVALLVIAYATILNQEKYSYKTWLPKIILMAILINYSKTICGVLITVAQVAMLTFVNAFKSIAAANLVQGLGITEIVKLADSADDLGFFAIVGAYILGLLYVLVAIVVITTMLAMLVIRMVMIWIYVVLSPLAYIMAAFPGAQKYSAKWWSDFTKHLIVGPVLAFFIWLSFNAMQNDKTVEKELEFQEKSATELAAGIGMKVEATNKKNTSSAQEIDVFLKFIIGIGMLVGGLQITNGIGGVAGSIAGKGMAKLQKGAMAVGNWGKRRVTGTAKALGRGAVGAVNKPGVRSALDKVASQRGVAGFALRATGVRKMSESALIGLGKNKAETEKKAKEKVEELRGAGGFRTLAMKASRAGYTPEGRAVKAEARKIFPVPVEKLNNQAGALATTDPKVLEEARARIQKNDYGNSDNKLTKSMAVWIGKMGLNLEEPGMEGAKKMIETDIDLAGAFKSGRKDAGLTDFVEVLKKDGSKLGGRYAEGRELSPSELDNYLGRTSGTPPFRPEQTDAEDDRLNYGGTPVPGYQKYNYPTVAGGQAVQNIVNAQRQNLEVITGTNDLESVEETRNRLHELNIRDGADYFQDEDKVKEVFAGAKKDVSEKRLVERRSESPGDRDFDEARLTAEGRGNLAINGFARGQEDYVGVDFSKLGAELQDTIIRGLKAGNGLSDARGFTTTDPGLIGKLASSVSGIIGQEISQLKGKGGNLSKSDSRRLANLESAQAKLDNPNELGTLEMINTSAKGFKSPNQVKETIMHEDLHGAGVDREDVVDFTVRSTDSRDMISTRKEAKQSRQFQQKMLANLMDFQKRNNKVKPTRDIIAKEKRDPVLAKQYNMLDKNIKSTAKTIDDYFKVMMRENRNI
ncbi:MAG: hypothetical protein ACOX0C_01335 [Patescibacteria group bacterium]|jgi:hypothetical protein